MGIIVNGLRYQLTFILFILILGCHEIPVQSIQEEPISKSPIKPAKENLILGLQSQQALGAQNILVVAVRFPDVKPRLSLIQIRRKAVEGLDQYVREQSYGLTWLEADFKGWIRLPDSISEYRVSATIDEIRYQKSRIRKLIEDTMTAIEEKVNFANYQHMLIIPGAVVGSEKGYGTKAYNANPGLLAKGTKTDRHYETFESKGGKMFSGSIFVGLEIAHLGMYAHDFFHALGGIYNGRALVP